MLVGVTKCNESFFHFNLFVTVAPCTPSSADVCLILLTVWQYFFTSLKYTFQVYIDLWNKQTVLTDEVFEEQYYFQPRLKQIVLVNSVSSPDGGFKEIGCHQNSIF